ncbi:tRNA (guanosine(46)-N7)-methyltransferase TrmB [Williamsoniiplasma lucivorax]|uniref:tRNA (guanine-N(7)-)-methyltransferase n=1 Tax=Williamsoniiplasma lucivorax TaxID=209274 RepID=A0A2S5RF11_9MOLU|nr:tRNA (guanosine(46)-N7)-methyltransferase TrmB [Williamsoniiplasma lucivorax]PPE05802.1 tRNA (guanine-N(7)-)-methyltransferase [Williamsoniiplasma lucivorax]
MRLRNKQWTHDFLKKHAQYLIDWNENKKINAQNFFGNNNPIYLEIGAGKGQFIIANAIQNPHINYIAMEKETTVVGVALKRAIQTLGEEKMTNLKFLNKFAENLLLMFEQNSVDHLFLNFSDPWPKAKHFKKRLTYTGFLDIYAQILKPNGILQFKTDNDGLFAFSLEQITQRPNWKLIVQTDDLYDDEQLLVNNIPTEYETKFHQMNKNINMLSIQNLKK